MGPARMIVKSLTSRPGIREQNRSTAPDLTMSARCRLCLRLRTAPRLRSVFLGLNQEDLLKTAVAAPYRGRCHLTVIRGRYCHFPVIRGRLP